VRELGVEGGREREGCRERGLVGKGGGVKEGGGGERRVLGGGGGKTEGK
jgi:hypothetical protein